VAERSPLSVTVGEASADYEDLDLTTSPHPNGYYALSNISGPVDPSTGQQDCQAVRSSLNCATGQPIGSSISVTFTVSPQYPSDSLNQIAIGYPDEWSESITFCGPGTSNAIIERKLFNQNTLVSDEKTGDSCPKIGIAGVRFAPRSQTQPSTPGLPVIWDRPGSVRTEQDQAATLSCPGIGLDPAQYDYLDCATNPVPQGQPVLNWPVVVPAGGALTLDEADLYSPTHVDNATLEATASLGGATLTLSQTGVSQTQAGSGYKLVASGPLKFSGTIPPAAVGRQMLQINWKLTSDAGVVTATSSHAVYVTANPYAAPTAHTNGASPSRDDGPYLSIIDLGTSAASGASGPAAVADAIWKRFTSRQVPEMTLDPATGDVTPSGNTFTYYGDRYHSEADYFNQPSSCPTLLAFLEEPDDGHCGDWAWFMEQVLAHQGVPSSDVLVGAEPGFDPGPPPFGQSAFGHNYMLIAPWLFGSPTLPATLDDGLSNPFTFANRITSSGGQLATSATAFRFNPGGQTIAQGNVSFPLGMFQVGDHRLVYVPAAGAYFDPSYGNPQSGGYASIHDWENAAVDGFAVLYAGRRIHKGKDLVVTVLPYFDLATLSRTCARLTCWLAAKPLAAYYPPSVGLPTLTGIGASFDVACPVGQPCTISADLTGPAGNSRRGVTAGMSAAHRSVRNVVLGKMKIRLRAGTSRKVTISLNARGRSLLRRFHRLPVTLTVKSGRRVLARTHLSFRRR
jgi:hypothetical protein